MCNKGVFYKKRTQRLVMGNVLSWKEGFELEIGNFEI